MTVQARVTRLRQVFGDVVAAHLAELQPSIEEALAKVPAARNAGGRQAAYPIHRCRLLTEVRRKARHHGLEDEMLAFTLEAGFETPGGLDLIQLEALAGWLDGFVERQDLACDSPTAPPAR